MSDTLPKEIGDLLWQEACRRADAIRKVLKCGNEQTSAAEIVGDQMGSAATNAVDVKSEVHSNFVDAAEILQFTAASHEDTV